MQLLCLQAQNEIQRNTTVVLYNYAAALSAAPRLSAGAGLSSLSLVALERENH
jgi:hypothetical protein